MSAHTRVAPTYRVVRHATASPGWVVQMYDDEDDVYWVSFWDGAHWTMVARQHRDGSVEDEVRLDGSRNDALVVQGLDALERRKELRESAHRAIPPSLAVGVGATTGSVIALAVHSPAWLALGLALAGLVGFVVALAWVFQGRGRSVVWDTDAYAHQRRHAEITGELSENATLGSELGVALAVCVGTVVVAALVPLIVVELL